MTDDKVAAQMRGPEPSMCDTISIPSWNIWPVRRNLLGELCIG
ncbi:hypothetical protein [Nocardia arizonensis]|nr:hypothetical protein [Nocardia arizonensis]